MTKEALLLERIDRLRRLAEIRAPGVILVEALKLILRHCLIHQSEHTSKMLGDLFVEGSRIATGICPFCGKGRLREALGWMCQECSDEADREVAAIEFESEAPKGGVS